MMPSLSEEIKTKKQFSIHVQDLDETHELGRQLGALIPEGAMITLTGGLGAGKTSFVQGLAKGLEVPEGYYVTSPTYNIINEYPGKHTLYHIDLYRIADVYELDDIGFEDLLDGTGVVAVEWPDRLPPGTIKETIGIEIEILADDTRKFSFSISSMDLPG